MWVAVSPVRCARVVDLGVDPSLIRRRDRPNGAYLLHGDLTGHRQLSYWRNGSAASTLDIGDTDGVTTAGALVLSGVTAALSETTEALVVAAARMASDAGVAVVYDPNFRARLTSPARASAVLAAVAPSCPGDTVPLLGKADPATALMAGQGLGAQAVAVTSGTDAVLAGGVDGRYRVPVPANENAIDATGAGDVFTGTTAARLALGDPLVDAVRLGIGAVSCSVTGRGGTGHIPTLAESRAAVPR
ncbi:MAG TPA: PfkB family carbohydrate kinase [Pseudonocardiaceae bacterium]|nr:PfkB family carbohydrate kinase [Pseudonocardiaceae bacterium]